MGVTATFHGPYMKGYLQYIDLSTYHTLVAVPGNTYDVGIASGWEVLAAIPGDGLWTTAELFPASFSAVPGFAAPGAFFPASPGIAPVAGGPVESVFHDESVFGDDDVDEEEAWAQQVVADATAADGKVFAEVREGLAGAGEKLAALRRLQGGGG